MDAGGRATQEQLPRAANNLTSSRGMGIAGLVDSFWFLTTGHKYQEPEPLNANSTFVLRFFSSDVVLIAFKCDIQLFF